MTAEQAVPPLSLLIVTQRAGGKPSSAGDLPPALAPRLAALLERVFDRPLPYRVSLWDGSSAGPADAPTLVIPTPRALRRLYFPPSALNFVRAYSAGEIRVDGDLVQFLYDIFDFLTAAMPRTTAQRGALLKRGLPAGLGLLRLGLENKAVGWPLPRPESEMRRSLRGTAAVRYHYELSNDFYAMILGPTMVYSTACWSPTTPDLDSAQRNKLDIICRKLELRPGSRLLDIGCGWGSLLLHAAEHYGVTAVGVTLSPQQAEYATTRIAATAFADRIEVRVCDYALVDDGPYDAISSIEMNSHLPRASLPGYARTLHHLLKSGGRLLQQNISTSDEGMRHARRMRWLNRYVIPDTSTTTLHDCLDALGQAGLDVIDIDDITADTEPTYRAVLANFDHHWDSAGAEIGIEQARAWYLFLAAFLGTAYAGWFTFEQITAVKP
ncbi:cyclopropane-fatty-acyl-phospholipid synthase family protein [Nocardia sp. NBC_01499]|uniref:class I SAM-dependent methyltransferase n=1 Tax=Nocardia sp. NBC_01499 TaxID=2903597 RepID=UPI00386A4B8A